MRLSIKQLAMSNFPYYKHSLTYALDSLQRLGARAIELYAVEPHLHIEDSTMADVHSVKRMLNSRGMQTICLTPEQMRYPINIAAQNPYARKRSIDTFVKALEFSAELECPLVQFHAGYPLCDEAYEDAWKRSVESLTYLSRIAQGLGIIITLEFVDIRWKTVLRNSAKVSQMITELDCQNVKGMIDVMCLTICDETIDQALTNLGDDFIHCHFTDGTGLSTSTQHLVPGEGVLDLDYMISAMAKVSYKGYLTLELTSPYEEEPELVMRKASEWMCAHLD